MAVLRTRPHLIERMVTEGGYTDKNGNYHAGESRWEEGIRCDAVPSGKASEREFEDGKVRSYSYTVYLPKDCPAFTIGDGVRITLTGGTVREFTVKGFHRWQHQCRLWV